MSPDSTVDIFLGSLLFTCCLFGVPANFISLLFFTSRQTKDLPTCIYIVTTICDMLITTFILVPGLSFLSERDPMLFGVQFFCSTWGLFIAVFPALSSFTLALLGVTRTYNLRYPLHPLKRKGCLHLLGCYCMLLVSVPHVLSQSSDFQNLLKIKTSDFPH